MYRANEICKREAKSPSGDCISKPAWIETWQIALHHQYAWTVPILRPPNFINMSLLHKFSSSYRTPDSQFCLSTYNASPLPTNPQHRLSLPHCKLLPTNTRSQPCISEYEEHSHSRRLLCGNRYRSSDSQASWEDGAVQDYPRVAEYAFLLEYGVGEGAGP